MIYVTHGYTTKQFETDEQALSYVTAEMDKEELSYLPVYDHADEYGVRVIVPVYDHADEYGVRVIVYQYYTLYMETFVLHKQFNLRRI